MLWRAIWRWIVLTAAVLVRCIRNKLVFFVSGPCCSGWFGSILRPAKGDGRGLFLGVCARRLSCGEKLLDGKQLRPNRISQIKQRPQPVRI